MALNPIHLTHWDAHPNVADPHTTAPPSVAASHKAHPTKHAAHPTVSDAQHFQTLVS